MSLFPLKPTHKPVKAYYAALQQFQLHGHTTEGNTRSAFADLLKRCSSPYGWHLVEEYKFKGTGKQDLRADGALVDELTLVHGLWEAKDSDDDLQKEIKAKVAKGYPLTNTLFQSPDRAVLYQDNRIALDTPLTAPENLIEVLQLFFEHRQAHEVDWEDAVLKFSEKIPDLAGGVTKILTEEHKKNADFRDKFQAFAELCRQSINPELTDDAIQKMLVQHLLTERIFRKVFNNPEFTKRNVIAVEIEKVISSITNKHFSRDTFLQPLDRFYKAIEEAAETQTGYTEKQHFLNAVYEKFFKSFDAKQADTMGIVYTPQPIVDFIVRSVEEALQSEFGQSLSDENVHILDPFTGTGNFITRIMQQIKKSSLSQKYSNELHCNEIMLLPYYIASMNIEHAYLEAMGQYESFAGICLVDTFELSEASQRTLFTSENTERVEAQKKARITVILGNPPYRAWQQNAADRNKNRKYVALDARVKETYVQDSTATLTTSVLDPYVKAFRWASDRIGDSGIVCFVTNNGFLNGKALDGMREHLARDFNAILHIDLKGNAHTSGERRKREAGNIFENQIRVGVGITLLIRKTGASGCHIRAISVPDYLSSAKKASLLNTYRSFAGAPLEEVVPTRAHIWISQGKANDFEDLLPLGGKLIGEERIFAVYSNGPKSNNDAYVSNFSKDRVIEASKNMVAIFNSELARWIAEGRPEEIEKFIRYDEGRMKWIRRALNTLVAEKTQTFETNDVRLCAWRPYTTRWRYFNATFNEDLYQSARFFPTGDLENRVICINDNPAGGGFFLLGSNQIPDHHFTGDSQCFPFYTYSGSDTTRRENITDETLGAFQRNYRADNITKWDIFHYVYAALHHPGYRTLYVANLKRQLPRIPYAPDFKAFANAGQLLMSLHVAYEDQPQFKLEEIEIPGVDWTLRVEKMRLSKDRSELVYNKALTLRGIPPKVFEYQLGSRCALEWVIEQYRVSTDKRSGILNDPNRDDEPDYILKLIRKVITVSLETVEIVEKLARLPFRPMDS